MCAVFGGKTFQILSPSFGTGTGWQPLLDGGESSGFGSTSFGGFIGWDGVTLDGFFGWDGSGGVGVGVGDGAGGGIGFGESSLLSPFNFPFSIPI